MKSLHATSKLLRAVVAIAFAACASATEAGKPAVEAFLDALAPRHEVQTVVTGVADGDTFYVVLDGQSRRIRLAEIDAPEKVQPFGRRSEQSLRELVWKRTVTLRWSHVDQYGRPVAKVIVNGLDVNAEQVRRGMAWVYTRYTNDAQLLELQAAARSSHLGLWADPHPIAPWVWRESHRTPQ